MARRPHRGPAPTPDELATFRSRLATLRREGAIDAHGRPTARFAEVVADLRAMNREPGSTLYERALAVARELDLQRWQRWEATEREREADWRQFASGRATIRELAQRWGMPETSAKRELESLHRDYPPCRYARDCPQCRTAGFGAD